MTYANHNFCLLDSGFLKGNKMYQIVFDYYASGWRSAQYVGPAGHMNVAFIAHTPYEIFGMNILGRAGISHVGQFGAPGGVFGVET